MIGIIKIGIHLALLIAISGIFFIVSVAGILIAGFLAATSLGFILRGRRILNRISEPYQNNN